MSNQYDEQIERLKRNETTPGTDHDFNSAIRNDWNHGVGLFKILGEHSNMAVDENDDVIYSGCLTQIKANEHMFAFIDGKPHKEFTEKVRNDERIPTNPYNVQIENFIAFKELQEEYDALVAESK